MRRFLLGLPLLALLFTGSALSSGCYGSSGYVGVEAGTPPPPQSVYYDYRAGHVFVEGRWVWQNNQWVWRPGYWVVSRPGFIYTQGYWYYDTHWHWHTGRWLRARRGYIHTRGYWGHRNGRRHWVRGKWVKRRPGYNYTRGRWIRSGGKARWKRGTWSPRRRDNRRAPVRRRATPRRRR